MKTQLNQVLFTDKDLRNLHNLCLAKLIEKARKETDSKRYASRLATIKNLFFDKIYYKRGFSYNPQTKKYNWCQL